MSVKMAKTGVIKAGGTGIGENLLANTSSAEVKYTIPENTGTSSFRDFWSAKTIEVPSGNTYILSFYAKADVDGTIIRTHYYSPNTTTKCVSSQGISNTASDGHMNFTLTTEWELYWVIYTQSETTAVKNVICPRIGNSTFMTGQKTGNVYIKMVKFEAGDKVTPWTPAKTEMNYVSDANGYLEQSVKSRVSAGRDYIVSNEFYEI